MREQTNIRELTEKLNTEFEIRDILNILIKQNEVIRLLKEEVDPLQYRISNLESKDCPRYDGYTLV